MTVYFQFGTSTGYGSGTPFQNMGNISSPLAFSANIMGLTPNVLYHYRAVASSVNFTTYGADKTFTTLSEGGDFVGGVNEIYGDVKVKHLDGTESVLHAGDYLREGDIVITSKTGLVNIRFTDNTLLAISENAKITIDQYAYDAATQEGSSVFSWLQGMFVYTSGLIGHTEPGNVNIDTPVGSLGIRGTEFICRRDPCSVTNEVYLIHGQLAIRPKYSGITNFVDAPATIFYDSTNVVISGLTQAAYDALKIQVSQTNAPTFGSWQVQYFGCTNGNTAAAATADPDGDGQNNDSEFLAGTDPTSNASFFRILSAAITGKDMRVTWRCGGGRTNVLQSTTRLGGSWSNVSANIFLPGSGDVTTNYLDAGTATNAIAKFYRVQLIQ